MSDHHDEPGAAPDGMASRSISFDGRTRSDDSWVELSSQPSSSSLSSVADNVVTTGLRVQQEPRTRRRRTLRPGAPSHLNINNRPSSAGGTSSQEEYEESESESDRVMTSSGEGLPRPAGYNFLEIGPTVRLASAGPRVEEDDEENRTAVGYRSNNDTCFTPQPNAFSHPPSSVQMRHASQPVPGSYFPSTRPAARPAPRQTLSAQHDPVRHSHLPQNILSPSYSAAIQHDEALRASLTTLLSCAAAARGLPKTDHKRTNAVTTPARSNRVEPMSVRLIPESALPATSPPHLQEPTFHPTIRRTSTSTSASSERQKENKRKATTGRSLSRERRTLKKARRSSSSEDLHITPTLLTWVVSAGVVVFLSALSFSAGYSIGKEAGRLEAADLTADAGLRTCAREAGRSGLGIKRSLARSAVQV